MSTSVRCVTPLLPSRTHYCNLSSALQPKTPSCLVHFRGPNIDNAWAERCADLSRAVNRLSLISSQDSLSLLRASFSAPREQRLLRCSPSVNNAGLATFDELLRTALCRISNCDLTDTHWLHASLAIREGGLGGRQVASLVLPALLASAASTQSLQAAILPSHFSQADFVF